MIHYLQNDTFTIGVQEHGAELCSFKNIATNLEYIWQADPAVWSRHAPVLFPIVGKLKNNTYEYDGHQYELPQHGFARDQEFTLVESTEDSLLFELHNTLDTIIYYPFRFTLLIYYKLEANSLTVSYSVKNTGDKDLYFSIGAHPGFTCPLFPEVEAFTDYYLQFEIPESLERYLLDQGLQNGKTEPVLLQNNTNLPLTYELFEKDAIVLKNIHSEKISLRSHKQEHGLDFTFRGYPYLGIWTKGKNSPFICLEPWHGIASSVDSAADITQKEGIKFLAPAGVFNCSYTVEVF